jgi:hypothetical protein
MATNRIGFSSDFVLSNSNLGLGVASPTTKLDIVDSGNPTITLRGSDGAYTSILNLQAGGGGASVISATGGTNTLRFLTNDQNRVLIDSSGNTLINTLSATGTASQPLQVTGGAYISGNLGVGNTNPEDRLDLGSGYLRFKEAIGGTGIYGAIRAFNTLVNSVPATAIRFIRDVAEIGNDGAICFDTVNAERLRIDSSGNLLINTTSATGTASQKLQVTGGAYVSGGLGVGINNNTTAGTISASSYIIAGGAVYAAGASGFYSTTFAVNARNPIWRFGNADGYGLSYFQGTSGVSPSGGGDTLGFHFGTATAAASLLQLNNGSGAVVNGTLGVSANLIAWDTTTPAGNVGGLHLGAASGTSNAGPAITFGARDSLSGTTGQAGIYINSDASYGTRMYFATTDSYAVGSKVAMSISETGTVTLSRSGLTVAGQFQSTQANSTTTGGGQIHLNGATGNRIDFNRNGVAAPSFTTRSVGTKLVLYPGVSGSAVDFGFGIDSNTLWSSVPTSVEQFKWYAGTTNIATLSGTGNLTIGGGISGATATPTNINLGVSASNGTTRDKLKIYLYNDGTEKYGFGVGISGDIQYHSNVTHDFYINNGAAVRINSSGNLLIATTSDTGTASQKLQVTGGAYISGNLGLGVASPTQKLDVNGDIQQRNGAGVSIGKIENASGWYSFSADPSNVNGAQISHSTAIRFLTSSTERLRIDSSGNIKLTANTYQALAHKNYGYSSIYGAVVIGATGNYYTTVSLGVDVSTITGGNFSAQNQVIFPSNGALVPNNAGTDFIGVFSRNSSNAILIGPETLGGIASGPLTVTSTTVGIGTASPAENLHIHNPNTSLSAIRLSGSAVNQTPFNIRQGIVGTNNGGFSIYDVNNSATRFAIDPSGNIGIGTNDPTYKLHVVGSFGATTKSFIIDHPTKEGKKLQYGSLEGPELGVYIRGRTQESIIELPDYWTGLVREETITVNITAIGNKNIWVEKIEDNKVYINSKNKIDCFYTIFGERKDVAKLEVEM